MGEITQKYLKMKKNEKMSTYFVHILKKKKIEIKILLRRPFESFPDSFDGQIVVEVFQMFRYYNKILVGDVFDTLVKQKYITLTLGYPR